MTAGRDRHKVLAGKVCRSKRPAGAAKRLHKQGLNDWKGLEMQAKVKPASEAFERAVSAIKDIDRYEELKPLLGIIVIENSMVEVISALSTFATEEEHQFERAGFATAASVYEEIADRLTEIKDLLTSYGEEA